MLSGRAHASKTALIEIIVAIEDTLQKGSGELSPPIKPSVFDYHKSRLDG